MVKQRINVKIATQAFMQDLTSQKIHEKLAPHLDCDPNQNYKILSDIIEKCRKKHFPEKLVKFNKRRHKANKWITYGVIKSINSRDKMYQDFKKLSPNDSKYNDYKRNLATFNVILKKTIRECKMVYYDRMFEKYKYDIKNTWKMISEIFNKSNKNKNTISKILKNGEQVIGSRKIAN